MNDDKPSLNLLTFKASSWTMMGYGICQFERFLGNLILTRLLLPQDFGMMQLVNVFIQGLYMFSDLGIGANIIRHARGEDPTFLRTAWTIQVVRGLIMWVCIIFISLPIALLYDAPKLLWLLPIAGLSIVIDSFESLSLLVFNRRLQMSKIIMLDIVSQTAGIIMMVICAWYWRSVWTLLVSGLTSAMIKTIISNVRFPNPKMFFQWNYHAAHEIIHFGKWIFFSTMTNFLMSRLDRIIMGLYLSLNYLGYYGLALGIVSVFTEGVFMVTGKVLTPLYAHLQQLPKDQMRRKMTHIRLALMLVTLPPLYVLAIWGNDVIAFLYPKNYQNAGWMLQIMAAGYTVRVITAGMSPYFIVIGDSYRLMITQLSQSIVLMVSLIIGGQFGPIGLVTATVIPELLNYPVLAYCIHRSGAWQPLLDLGAIVISALIIGVGLYARS